MATPEAGLPVYADGTARINALLGASLDVVIPPGVYTIYGELDVRNGQTISAAADTKVILKTADGYTGRIINASYERVTVRNITFDGNYARRMSLEGAGNSAALVHVANGADSVFENNVFQYAPSHAMYVYKSPRVKIRGNTFHETYYAIRMDGDNLPESGTIEGNAFKNTDAYKSIQHLTATATHNLVVRNNTWEGAGLAEPTSHGYEGTWGNSIYIFDSTGYLVEGNKVGRNHWSSLVSGSNGKNAIIRNNSFTDGKTSIAAWIEQGGAEYITFDSNQLDGGLFVGDNGGDHLTITNNVIRSRGVGIDVSFATKTALIQGNKFYKRAGYERTGSGIYLWEKKDPATNVQVIGNHIEGYDRGISVSNYQGIGTVYGISLSGNTFANNNVNVHVSPSITLAKPLGQ
ncbi:right-handed parallel beta-helix repeat-containing protein [Ramlibacter rhizophilus]|uniref:Right handed beta helix domain-containing protein n=1 Tax=Ramlibacter rhizophilus TaxID=1781167 RepID=A0A4Z0BFH8_9BURK|nr:right-handed parallel beta-helix repeat-containing protein [Ramlibacter rhizophilus]TFY96884.1 hypothetical protein EZ242_19620 [Ramlibacter rhizophilus]